MYCVKCGQQIPNQVYIVRYVSDDPYQIAIETNDETVIERCRRIHSKCNYKLEENKGQSNILKDSGMLYFITFRISEIPLFIALGISTKEILFKHRNFDQRLENFLFLTGYQKLPGEDIVYLKKK